MPAQTAAAPALSRAHRRAIEKAARRAPKATIHRHRKRTDLPLRLIPWNIHGVWAPLDTILDRLEKDGTIEWSGGEPVLYDAGTADWHNSAQAIRGIADFHEIAARRKGWTINTEPIHRIARLLESDDEITQQDIDDVRTCSAMLRRLSGELTLGEARAYLNETCIRIEVERAGLCDSIEMETTGHGL
ncbi:hypothetical protein [Parazoarcus communis]|uniref:Uncharacterized protein n=1 Tax=Parazoarcus communis SWub3 = DSM 12120 TaxID=1121029 RepID=A0A323UWX7_9RHOO|nr:hypothetical protein [Parazoarcus communis]NMG70330.1 hypothetical protein [Parazoarcus communis SWub3 = DSM 12120]PZA16130.1 hypothetical protein DNK49_13915 [Azoarcus communis] [Parazoarcus communis SWub3 = DSM 12120]